MKTNFNNHQEIINKLNKLNFVKKDDKKLISEDGFEFTWTYKLNSKRNNQIGLPSIQLIISIQYNKALVTSWGCTSNEDTSDFIEFICTKNSVVREFEYTLRDNAEIEGHELFNKL